jgi:hypothetical protein
MTKLSKNSMVRTVSVILNIVWIVQWIGVVFIILFSIYLAVSSGEGSLNLHIPINFETVDKGTIQFLENKANNFEIEFARGRAVISGPIPIQILIYYFIISEIMFGIAIYITYLLQMFFKSLKNEDPFVRENGKRLRSIGLAIIIGSILWNFFTIFYSSLIRTSVSMDGIEIGTHLNFKFEIILLGLIILVISEVFQLGAELKEEQELTI